MSNKITLIGKIGFDPKDKTKKHENQASWKKMAMIYLEGDTADYYSWFIKERYGITLNKPIRGAHISFVNDSIMDLRLNGKRSQEDAEKAWQKVKKKWNGKPIEVVLDLDPRTDGRTWWLNVPHEDRCNIQTIRDELGLGRPFFGLHMTVGYANETNIVQSEYIHELIKKGFIK